jgi:hypothetical protein
MIALQDPSPPATSRRAGTRRRIAIACAAAGLALGGGIALATLTGDDDAEADLAPRGAAGANVPLRFDDPPVVKGARGVVFDEPNVVKGARGAPID